MTQAIPTKLKKDGLTGAVVCKCYHCGEEYGAAGSGYGARCAIFCKNCKKAEQRQAMDNENLEINPSFVCRYCTAIVEYRKRQKEEKDNENDL